MQHCTSVANGTSRWFTAMQCLSAIRPSGHRSRDPGQGRGFTPAFETDPEKKCTGRPGRKGDPRKTAHPETHVWLQAGAALSFSQDQHYGPSQPIGNRAV
jgi:hypothetical protein